MKDNKTKLIYLGVFLALLLFFREPYSVLEQLVLFPKNPCDSGCARAPRLDASHTGRDFWETTLKTIPKEESQSLEFFFRSAIAYEQDYQNILHRYKEGEFLEITLKQLISK